VRGKLIHSRNFLLCVFIANALLPQLDSWIIGRKNRIGENRRVLVALLRPFVSRLIVPTTEADGILMISWSRIKGCAGPEESVLGSSKAPNGKYWREPSATMSNRVAPRYRAIGRSNNSLRWRFTSRLRSSWAGSWTANSSWSFLAASSISIWPAKRCVFRSKRSTDSSGSGPALWCKRSTIPLGSGPHFPG
jgi:hypothetical protein